MYYRIWIIRYFVTVTIHDAVKLPSTVVTVMVAVPSFIPVTLPISSTVATVGLLLDHVTALLVAPKGITEAFNCIICPVEMLISLLSRVTPVTGTLPTVTRQDAVKFPSTVVTVILATPVLSPVTFPVLSTCAIVLSLLVHVTALLLALVGVTVAINWISSPISILAVFLSSDTPVTGSIPPSLV